MNAALDTWHNGAAKQTIVDFVNRATDPDRAGFVPPEQRVAVFDNDGTLWCERPTQIQLFFTLNRFAELAEADAHLKRQQPWKAACENDLDWLAGAVTKHYHGDDSDLRVLLSALPKAFADLSVEEYGDRVLEFFGGHHPVLNRPYLSCGFRPMVDLLRYLEANGFATYIASGGDRDFMRPVAMTMYDIPPERVIGSSLALEYRQTADGTDVLYKDTMDFFDDGPTKPVRIWSRIGRRPTIAAGNANGDIPMLRFAGGMAGPALRLLILHDDGDREFAYTAGAEEALAQANDRGWTVISMKRDWTTVFDDASS